MPSVTFQPSGITLDIEAKTTLLDAARRAGVEIDAPCGGKGTCGNCAVRIVSGEMAVTGCKVRNGNVGPTLGCQRTACRSMGS